MSKLRIILLSLVMGLQRNNDLALLRRSNAKSSEEKCVLVHSRNCAELQPLTACHKKPRLLQGVPVTSSPPLPQGKAYSLYSTELRGKSLPKSESSLQALDLTLKIAAPTHTMWGLLRLLTLFSITDNLVGGLLLACTRVLVKHRSAD